MTITDMKYEIIRYFSVERVGNIAFNDLMLRARHDLEIELQHTMKDIPIVNGTEASDYYESEIYNFYLRYVYGDEDD
jgi:hypothetical protein